MVLRLLNVCSVSVFSDVYEEAGIESLLSLDYEADAEMFAVINHDAARVARIKR